MKVTTNKATATRVNNQWVITRTKTGAPRQFQAGVGELNRTYLCMCPKAGGCSHEQALLELLTLEASTMQVAHVVA